LIGKSSEEDQLIGVKENRGTLELVLERESEDLLARADWYLASQRV
jgi:hypothetical protein